LDKRQKGVDDLPMGKAVNLREGLVQIALIQKIEELFLETAAVVHHIKGPCARQSKGEGTLTATFQMRSEGGEKESRFLFKLVLPRSAHRAYPVPGQFFKRSPGFYAVVRITHCRIIHITAHGTHVFCHNDISSLKYSKLTLAKRQKMLKIKHHFAVRPGRKGFTG
jgi:hypothetical protein